MGGCHDDVISPPESPMFHDDGGVLEHQATMFHHTYLRFNRLRNQPTSRNSRLGDQLHLYISWSSSRQSYWSDIRLEFKDRWLVDRPNEK
jgi:hypothetical protein